MRVSTGCETSSASSLDGVPAAHGPVPGEALLATLVELTAVTVGRTVAPHRPTEVVASGGGTADPALVDALARHVGDVPPTPGADSLDLPPRTPVPTRLRVRSAAVAR